MNKLLTLSFIASTVVAHSPIRTDFPIFNQTVHGHKIVYFDNAATTQKPQVMIDALVDFYQKFNSNVHRNQLTFAQSTTEMYEDARAKVATFINAATPAEIVFTSGTTASINGVALMLEAQLFPGDEIVVTELEHHANILPWTNITQKTGATLRFIPVTPEGTLDLSHLEKIITRATKLVAVTLCSNAIGTHTDVQPIVQAARKVGALVLLDGAQSVAHQKTDVQELDADFFVFSGHKILGPTGIGVLYINERLHNQLPPYFYGGGMVEETTGYESSFHEAPYRYEAGTPPIAQAIALGAALNYFTQHIDFNWLATYETHLCRYAIEQLEQLEQIMLLGPINDLKKFGHMISFRVKNCSSHAVANYLGLQGISVRASKHCAHPLAIALGYPNSVRMSFFGYNTTEEIDYCIAKIKEFLADPSLWQEDEDTMTGACQIQF